LGSIATYTASTVTDTKYCYYTAANGIACNQNAGAGDVTAAGNNTFTGSNIFSSTVYSNLVTYLQGSNVLNGSNYLSNTTSISGKVYDSSSNTHSGTNYFSGSNQFSTTNYFSGSVAFVSTVYFSGSNGFAGTNYFSGSNSFTSTNYLSGIINGTGSMNLTGNIRGYLGVSNYSTAGTNTLSTSDLNGQIFRFSSVNSVNLGQGAIGANALFRVIGTGAVSLTAGTNDHFQAGGTTYNIGSVITIPGAVGNYMSIHYGASSVWEVYGTAGTWTIQ
jgi:hypothetical protein